MNARIYYSISKSEVKTRVRPYPIRPFAVALERTRVNIIDSGIPGRSGSRGQWRPRQNGSYFLYKKYVHIIYFTSLLAEFNISSVSYLIVGCHGNAQF